MRDVSGLATPYLRHSLLTRDAETFTASAICALVASPSRFWWIIRLTRLLFSFAVPARYVPTCCFGSGQKPTPAPSFPLRRSPIQHASILRLGRMSAHAEGGTFRTIHRALSSDRHKSRAARRRAAHAGCRTPGAAGPAKRARWDPASRHAGQTVRARAGVGATCGRGAPCRYCRRAAPGRRAEDRAGTKRPLGRRECAVLGSSGGSRDAGAIGQRPACARSPRSHPAPAPAGAARQPSGSAPGAFRPSPTRAAARRPRPTTTSHALRARFRRMTEFAPPGLPRGAGPSPRRMSSGQAEATARDCGARRFAGHA